MIKLGRPDRHKQTARARFHHVSFPAFHVSNANMIILLCHESVDRKTDS